MTILFHLSEESQLQNKGYVHFAHVGRPHGVKGAFFLKTPEKRTHWDGYKMLVVETLSGYAEKKVLKAFVSGRYLALQLEGLSSRESIEALYHKKIYVHESQISLKEEEFLVAKLIGYEVISTHPHRRLGTVIGVSSFGAQDNLEILLENKSDTIFYPFMDRFVKNINETNKTIEVFYVPEFFEGTQK